MAKLNERQMPSSYDKKGKGSQWKLVEIMRGKAVDVNVVILPSGVGLRSVKRLDGYGARLYPPSRPHPTSSNSITALHRTPPRRPYKTSFSHGYELLSYIWRSLWKKRNACVFICRFCHVTPRFRS